MRRLLFVDFRQIGQRPREIAKTSIHTANTAGNNRVDQTCKIIRVQHGIAAANQNKIAVHHAAGHRARRKDAGGKLVGRAQGLKRILCRDGFGHAGCRHRKQRVV